MYTFTAKPINFYNISFKLTFRSAVLVYSTVENML